MTSVESDGTVRFEYSKMERSRPYPFQIGDRWLIAVLEPGESQASIYYFPEDGCARRFAKSKAGASNTSSGARSGAQAACNAAR